MKQFGLNPKSLFILLCTAVALSFTSLKAQTESKDSDAQRLEAQEHYYKACMLMTKKDYTGALALLTKSDSLWSHNAPTLNAIGDCYRAMEQETTALSFYQSASKLDPDDWDYLFDLLQVYANGKQFNEAIDQLRPWIDQHKRNEKGLEVLAKLYYNAGEVDSCIQVYDRLQDLNPRNFDFCLRFTQLRANLYDYLERGDESDKEYLKLEQSFPKHPEAYLIYLKRLIYKNKNKQALKTLNAYLKDKKISLEDYRYYGLFIWVDQDDVKKARLNFPIALRTIREDRLDDFCINLGKFISKQNDKNLSDKTYNYLFDYIIRHYPKRSKLRLIYAEILSNQQDYGKALSILLPAIDSDASNPKVWEDLINILQHIGDNRIIAKYSFMASKHIKNNWRYYVGGSLYVKETEGLDACLQFLDQSIQTLSTLEPKEGFGLSLLCLQKGDLLEQKGDFKARSQAYEQGIKFNPSNPYLLNNYAFMLSKQEIRLDEAERMSANAVRLMPKEASFLDTYAWIFFQRGNLSLASLYQNRAIDEAKQKGEDKAIYYEHLGFIQLAEGNKKDARTNFLIALLQYKKSLKKKGISKEDQTEISAKIEMISSLITQ